MAFDTLKYSKKLIAGGFTQQQAEIQAEAMHDIMHDQLATKQDIVEVRRDMKELELRLTIRLGGMMLAGFIICTSILGYLITHH